MNKNSNSYIIIYATAMIVLAAAVLAVTSLSLKGRQNANLVVEKQGAILGAIDLGTGADHAPDKTKYIQDEFAKYIVESYVVDGTGATVEGVEAFSLLDSLKVQYAAPAEERRLPVFVARLDDGTRLGILPLYGTGLWGPVWGYIALEGDWDTVYGVVFDHQGETPGLGAEIAEDAFEAQFAGKRIFSGGKFTGLSVLKGAGASAGNPNAVDAVTGGTITSRAVQDMIVANLTAYMPMIERMKTAQVGATAAERMELINNTNHE